MFRPVLNFGLFLVLCRNQNTQFSKWNFTASFIKSYRPPPGKLPPPYLAHPSNKLAPPPLKVKGPRTVKKGQNRGGAVKK